MCNQRLATCQKRSALESSDRPIFQDEMKEEVQFIQMARKRWERLPLGCIAIYLIVNVSPKLFLNGKLYKIHHFLIPQNTELERNLSPKLSIHHILHNQKFTQSNSKKNLNNPVRVRPVGHFQLDESYFNPIAFLFTHSQLVPALPVYNFTASLHYWQLYFIIEGYSDSQKTQKATQKLILK